MATQALCKALGNEDRLRLITCLAKPRSVTELLGHCSLSQSALSQHLKVLRDAGVVTARREGKQVLYKAADKKVAAIAKLLLHYKKAS